MLENSYFQIWSAIQFIYQYVCILYNTGAPSSPLCSMRNTIFQRAPIMLMKLISFGFIVVVGRAYHYIRWYIRATCVGDIVLSCRTSVWPVLYLYIYIYILYRLNCVCVNTSVIQIVKICSSYAGTTENRFAMQVKFVHTMQVAIHKLNKFHVNFHQQKAFFICFEKRDLCNFSSHAKSIWGGAIMRRHIWDTLLFTH